MLSIGNVPESILKAIRLGRITALSKPDGGVRGIVVGDILRRLVVKTMAKQISKEAEAATAPFQYALSTKAGCKCVAHILQSITDLDSEATVISIDGIGAYDLISRNPMLEGLSLDGEGRDVSMGLRQHICGTTRWESPNTSTKGRGARRHPHVDASRTWATPSSCCCAREVARERIALCILG